MARTLAQTGRCEAAVRELETLRTLDPNAVEVALELGEVLCMAGKNEAALKVATEAKVETDRDKSRALLICACARRQMGELDTAESLLNRALKIEAGSARALYELGKVHESRGDLQKALSCYRRALEEVFGEVRPESASRE